MTDIQITLHTGKMFIDKLDSMRLQVNGIYGKEETRFIQTFVKPNMICVDIGANIGYYTLIMAGIAKHTYAFEPEIMNYNILIKNIKLNNLTKNVTTYNHAVGQTTGEVTLYKCGTSDGMHRVYPSKWCNAGKETVHMVTLDSVIEDADFIKMDIEGAEYGALQGMRKILKKGVILLMEFHVPSIIEYGIEPKEIWNYMTDLGYKIEFLDRPLHRWETLNHRATKHAGINILCTPN